jgi:HYR domain-containing protein
MEPRMFRRAAALALVCLLISATSVFADTIPADGDAVEPGNQGFVYLGEFAPGSLTTTKVDFSLTCAGLQHADEGQTVTLALSGVTVPLNGTATATSTTIGPVPASWTDDTFGCPTPAPTLPANGQSTVTLRMPTTVGYGYIYTVMYSRAGANGLTGLTAISFEVDVVPNTPPVLTLPGPITAEATSPGGAAVTYAASSVDAEDNPDPTPVCSPVSGSTFHLGTTTVTCSVRDTGGLSASGSFTVLVADTTAPALGLPGHLTAEATGASGASVSFTTSASDTVDGSVLVNCDRASGDTFPLGTTTVTCSAADAAGNSRTGSFTISIADTTAPALGLPGNLTAEATGAGGASVSFTTSASDAVDGTVAVNCDRASADTFPFGTTTVTCSAADAAGNSTSGSFTITVTDTTGPALGLPGHLTAEATGAGGASVSFTTSASDAVDGIVPVTCDRASGDTFALGTTTVTCSAADATGNSTSSSFMISIADTTAPALGLPGNLTGEASSAGGASVAFTTSASDAVDGSVPVNCDHASGDTFPLGRTTVTCWAADGAGNLTTGWFYVSVGDSTAPALGLPGHLTAEATGASGASVNFTTSASDAVDGSVPVTCDHASGDTFPIGTTTVICSAADAAGNSTSGSFDVSIGDSTAPSLHGVPADFSVTTGNPAGRTVSYALPTATDTGDPNPSVACGPRSGSTFAVGPTTVTCTATDASGHSTSASFVVTVTYVAPPPPPDGVEWSVVWGAPIDGTPAGLITNTSRTVPIKVRLFADGVELTTGSASLRVVSCAGEQALVEPLTWGSARWNAHLDMSLLQPGCYVVFASYGSNDAGSFALDVRGADPAAKPATATAPTGKDKPKK